MTLKDMHLFFFVIFVIFDVAVNNMERDPTQRLDLYFFVVVVVSGPLTGDATVCFTEECVRTGTWCIFTICEDKSLSTF